LPLVTFSYSVFKVREPEAFKIPPLSFGHTMLAIAYTSGMFPLPSAAHVATVRPSRVLLGFPGSHWRPGRTRFSSEHSIARIRCNRQPLSTGSPIGTQCQGSHLVTGGNARRARN